MDNCMICWNQLNNNITYPNNCNCKVYFHNDCLLLVKSMGLLCPICKIKSVPIKKNNNLILQFFESPFTIFGKYPNIFTFIIMVIWSFIVTFIFIIPYFILLSTYKLISNTFLVPPSYETA